MNLKQYIFEHILRHQPKRQVCFPRWENIRSIVILYESDLMEKNFVVHQLANKLAKEETGKNVILLGYADKKDILSPNLLQSRVFGKKDFTIFGTPKSEIKEDLMRHPCDVMIDLSQNACLPLQYMALFTKADFKAGRHIREGLHDFMVDTPAQENEEFLFNQIIYYLKLIKSND